MEVFTSLGRLKVWIAFLEYHGKFPRTSSHYFRFAGSDVPSSELGKSALEVLKVFSKLSNLKMKSKS